MLLRPGTKKSGSGPWESDEIDAPKSPSRPNVRLPRKYHVPCAVSAAEGQQEGNKFFFFSYDFNLLMLHFDYFIIIH